MCLFGCNQTKDIKDLNRDLTLINKQVDIIRKNGFEREDYHYRKHKELMNRVEILERMFKESKEYKKAECEVLRAKQGS